MVRQRDARLQFVTLKPGDAQRDLDDASGGMDPMYGVDVAGAHALIESGREAVDWRIQPFVKAVRADPAETQQRR